MRVMCLVPIYGLWSILSICFPKANVYIEPWRSISEATSHIAYFLLLCEYVSPHQEEQAGYFNMVEISDKRAREKGIDGETWFKVCFKLLWDETHLMLLAETIYHDLSVSCCGAGVGYCDGHHRSRGHLLPVSDFSAPCQTLGKSDIHCN